MDYELDEPEEDVSCPYCGQLFTRYREDEDTCGAARCEDASHEEDHVLH